MHSINERVLKMLKDKGFNQADIATLWKTTQATISRKFASDKAFTLEELKKFSKILEVDIRELIDPRDKEEDIADIDHHADDPEPMDLQLMTEAERQEYEREVVKNRHKEILARLDVVEGLQRTILARLEQLTGSKKKP